MSRRYGIDDPNDWYNRWQAIHRSPAFAGRLNDLALAALQDPSSPDGMGIETLAYEEEDGRWIVVKVSYLTETYATGRVFHILYLLSPEDPALGGG